MDAPPDPIFPAAILFDMDGTITEPMLDFPAIKAQMGIGTQPILEALATMGAESRAAAEAILLRHEQEAAENSALNQGCRELLEWLHHHDIRTALVTRNSRSSVQTVIRRHGLEFDVLVTREDPPFKPDPGPLRLACKRLAVAEKRAWMVGDGQYDVQAGCAAGIRTVWVSHGRTRTFDAAPWLQVRDLLELRDLLETCGSAR
jgi:HAD superfamily hydrolase (TIGR01509 family)